MTCEARNLTPGTRLHNGGVVREVHTTGETTHLTYPNGGTWHGPAGHRFIIVTDPDVAIAIAPLDEVEQAARG
jgi:hypothetical protein